MLWDGKQSGDPSPTMAARYPVHEKKGDFEKINPNLKISRENQIQMIHLVQEKDYEELVRHMAEEDFSLLIIQESGIDFNIEKRKPQFPINYDKTQSFKHPRAICISECKRVFITDHGNSRIVEFSIDGEYKGEIRCGLKGPWGIAICGKILYVTDIEIPQIVSIHIDTKDVTEKFEHRLKNPRQLAVNEKKELWVPDDNINEVLILEIKPKMKQIHIINTNQLKLPMDVKFLSEYAFILNRNKSVCEYNQDSRQCTRIVKIDAESQGYFFFVTSDYFLISEVHCKSIQVYSKTGKKETNIGDRLEQMPLGICMHESDKLFVIFPSSSRFPWMIF